MKTRNLSELNVWGQRVERRRVSLAFIVGRTNCRGHALRASTRAIFFAHFVAPPLHVLVLLRVGGGSVHLSFWITGSKSTLAMASLPPYSTYRTDSKVSTFWC